MDLYFCYFNITLLLKTLKNTGKPLDAGRMVSVLSPSSHLGQLWARVHFHMCFFGPLSWLGAGDTLLILFQSMVLYILGDEDMKQML